MSSVPSSAAFSEATLLAQLVESAAFIKTQIEGQPEQQGSQSILKSLNVGIILGSGLGNFAETLPNPVAIEYNDIPHFPKRQGAVEGHGGRLWFSALSDHRSVVCMQGRFHLYEGFTPQQVAYPIRLMKQLGVETLIVTNAAGGIRPEWAPGTLMLMTDHLNLTGTSPLLGPNPDAIGPRFVDMTDTYSPAWQTKTKAAASILNIPMAEGVYAGLLGPCYETPAEVRMLRTLGADAVGMSTVTEVIAARHAGLAVLGLSCITNPAAGLNPQPLDHAEVMAAGQGVEVKLTQLLNAVLG